MPFVVSSIDFDYDNSKTVIECNRIRLMIAFAPCLVNTNQLVFNAAY